ncbi:MAG: hypothetical protein U0174_28160 [Polyangiaceae bacterium]
MKTQDKTSLDLNLRRVRKALRTDVNTGKAGAAAFCADGSRTQPNGTCGYSQGNG